MREMKDSGIEWVGKIPNDWAIKPLYCFFSERKNKNILGKEDNLLSLSYGKVIRKDINTNEGLLPSNYNGYNIVEAGDIVIRPTDLQNDQRSLRTGLVTERGIITSAYIALKPLSNTNNRFYHYLLHTYDILKVFYNMGGGVRQGLNYDEFAKLKIYSPSSSEQQRIADFLDRECGKIDSIIADVEKQIEILEQYKRSVISEKVTQGIDCVAEFISCDAKWLPMIPKSWSIKRGKYCFCIRNTKGNNITLELLSPTQKYGVIPQRLYEEYSTQVTVKVNERTNLRSFKTIHPGDFCISLRSFEGGFEYSTYEGVVSPAYTVFYPTIKCDRRYYKYLFKISQFIIEMNSYSLSLRDGKPISFDDFGNTYIPIPPLEEQQAIADYLDKKCAEIDGVIADKKRQLDVLENYKKSIIYEYVTGKRRLDNGKTF